MPDFADGDGTPILDIDLNGKEEFIYPPVPVHRQVRPARLAAAIQLLAFGFNCGFGRRLSVTFHKLRNECPLYDPEGRPVGDEIDSKVEHIFNRLLDKVTKFRQIMGKLADISLSSVLERLRQMYIVATKPKEKQLNDCHFANLEYANAGCLLHLSAV
ncbi:hypothetical protein Tco_1538687 [Tanacetum coccineum]